MKKSFNILPNIPNNKKNKWSLQHKQLPFKFLQSQQLLS